MRGEQASLTAGFVCLFRALDQGHPTPVLNDPFAAQLLSPSFSALRRGLTALRPALDVAAWGTLGLAGYVQARHRLIDEAALAATRAGTRQVLLLGAGFDARPWRHADDWANAHTFVVDHPSTARARRAAAHTIHAPTGPLTHVEIDFASESLAERLLAAGFRAGEPTVVIWEGVSMYLPEPAVAASLAALAGLCGSGSILLFDLFVWPTGWRPHAIMHRRGLGLLRAIGEPVRFAATPDQARTLLAAHGWHLTDAADANALRTRFVADRRGIFPYAWVATARRT